MDRHDARSWDQLAYVSNLKTKRQGQDRIWGPNGIIPDPDPVPGSHRLFLPHLQPGSGPAPVTKEATRLDLGPPFLQQPRPTVGAYVRRVQLNFCDGQQQGVGSDVSGRPCQAALLTDVEPTGRLPGCAMRRPVQMSNTGSWFLPCFRPGPNQGTAQKEAPIYRGDVEAWP